MMTKKYQKVALFSAAACVGGAIFYKRNFRMPLKEYTQYALYMATLDDEICRNELEGNCIDQRKIFFPPKAESLQYRYHLFLQMNCKKSRKTILHEISQMEERLAKSRQFRNQESTSLEVEVASEDGQADCSQQRTEGAM